jgi:acyl-coenzyme A thioesterase 9
VSGWGSIVSSLSSWRSKLPAKSLLREVLRVVASSSHTPTTMASIVRTTLRRLRSTSACKYPKIPLRLNPVSRPTARTFHSTSTQWTDGVFRALTEQRVRTPWIEALRKQQAEGTTPGQASGKQEVPSDRDLSPKRMEESYHSVILPLAQDPWLLDTYLNSSGHIRLGTIFMDLDALSGVIA